MKGRRHFFLFYSPMYDISRVQYISYFFIPPGMIRKGADILDYVHCAEF